VREWKNGTRTRVAIELWHQGRRYLIYSDVDRWGRRIALTRETANDLLEDIRAEIRQRRSIEAALAPFLGVNAPENTIRVRGKRFLGQKEREVGDSRITARHLRELRGVENRGYLEPLLDASILELDYRLLEDWLGCLADAKPDLNTAAGSSSRWPMGLRPGEARALRGYDYADGLLMVGPRSRTAARKA
jgi:hypothetical protein